MRPEVREYYRRLGETTRLSTGAGLLDWLRRVEDEPALLGAASHLLAVARPG